MEKESQFLTLLILENKAIMVVETRAKCKDLAIESAEIQSEQSNVNPVIPVDDVARIDKDISGIHSTLDYVNYNTYEPYRGGYQGNHGHNQEYNAVTRMTKLDFPRFYGSNLKDWLWKVTLDSLDGEAATWHQSFMLSEEGRMISRDWDLYKVEVMERFGDLLEDPMAESKCLQETDGIVDYHAKFERIRIILNLSQDYLVSSYIAGLRMDTQMHGRRFIPGDVKRDCRAKGLCYYYDEKWSHAHMDEKHKNTQLYLIVDDDETDETCNESLPEGDEAVDCAQISLSAMSGSMDYNTLKVFMPLHKFHPKCKSREFNPYNRKFTVKCNCSNTGSIHRKME
uniref:Polyprotein n=1 Tax=Boechera divaricarpa TaxID=115915 RepID=B6REK4_9BRAS|nr:polyprotein [Boechera divaricarpa]